MELKFLADKPEAVPLIAKWYYDQWGFRMKDNSVEKITERMQAMMNRDKVPLHLIAVENDKVLGVAQLKFREMDIYPDKEHWLGGVYIHESARGKGLASKVVTKAIALAKSFQIKTLYLQTEKMDGGLYARLGWKPLEKVHYNGLDVLVMANELAMAPAATSASSAL